MTRKEKILDLAKGYYGRSKNSYRLAKNRVEHGLQHAYRARKQRKRDYRTLWIQNINAATSEFGVKYSQFMHGLVLSGCSLNRKMLSELSQTEPMSMRSIVELSTSSRMAVAEKMTPKDEISQYDPNELYFSQKYRDDENFVYVKYKEEKPIHEKSHAFQKMKQKKEFTEMMTKRISDVTKEFMIQDRQQDELMKEKIQKVQKEKGIDPNDPDFDQAFGLEE